MNALELSTQTKEIDSNIVNAAKFLVERGKGGWSYETEWISGSTVWNNPTLEETVVVTVNAASYFQILPVCKFIF